MAHEIKIWLKGAATMLLVVAIVVMWTRIERVEQMQVLMYGAKP